MSSKIYVLDTTVLVHDPDIMFKLGNATIVIPIAVIRELDGLKRSGEKNVAYSARQVARTLDRISSYDDTRTGVKLSSGGILMTYTDYAVIDDLASQGDNRVVGAAIKLKEDAGGSDVTILTTDINVRNVARSYGLKAEFYPFGFDYEKAMTMKFSNKTVEINSYVTTKEEYLKQVEGTLHRDIPFKRERGTFKSKIYLLALLVSVSALTTLIMGTIAIFIVGVSAIAVVIGGYFIAGIYRRKLSRVPLYKPWELTEYTDPYVQYVRKD